MTDTVDSRNRSEWQTLTNPPEVVYLYFAIVRIYSFYNTYKNLGWILDKRFRGWQKCCHSALDAESKIYYSSYTRKKESGSPIKLGMTMGMISGITNAEILQCMCANTALYKCYRIYHTKKLYFKLSEESYTFKI